MCARQNHSILVRNVNLIRQSRSPEPRGLVLVLLLHHIHPCRMSNTSASRDTNTTLRETAPSDELRDAHRELMLLRSRLARAEDTTRRIQDEHRRQVSRLEEDLDRLKEDSRTEVALLETDLKDTRLERDYFRRQAEGHALELEELRQKLIVQHEELMKHNEALPKLKFDVTQLRDVKDKLLIERDDLLAQRNTLLARPATPVIPPIIHNPALSSSSLDKVRL